MFFVGATGHFVTILLTLLLPFYLLTAKRAECPECVQPDRTVYQIEARQAEVIRSRCLVKISGLVRPELFSRAENLKSANIRPKFPDCGEPAAKLFFILNDSGNKAPPVAAC